MTFVSGISRFLGVGGDRSAQPPRYAGLSDGLVITTDHAEAWYQLETSNTDLLSEEARDAEQDLAAEALSRVLAGQDCHLRVLWAPTDPAEYGRLAGRLFHVGRHEEWARIRMRRLEELELPRRVLLLGVRLTERAGPVAARGRAVAEDAAGLSPAGVPARDLARYDALARRLGRQLEATPWRARPASVELLAWAIARDLYRGAVLPEGDSAAVVSGARLAQLARGRVVPYPDHVRLVDGSGATVAWSAVLAMTAFPEQATSPGAGEWLRVLGEVSYLPDVDDDVETVPLLPVSPEASIRWRVMHRRDAMAAVDDVRKRAREQRISAADGSAGETSLHIQEAEAEMSGLARDMVRQDVTLVHDHPRLVVTSEAGYEDLMARVDAVVGHFGGMGVQVVVGEDEQRELWLETQLGDRLRVDDLGHYRDATALAGTWWWGGAAVGDDDAPVIGYLTGSTPGPVGFDLTAGSARGHGTTTLFAGRSGMGKTVAMMVPLLDSAFHGAWVMALDFKGDMGGLIAAAEYFGLPARLVETTGEHAGQLDLFRLLTGDAAPRATTEVPAQLCLALPGHLRERGAETPIQAASNQVVAEGNPATWRVIEVLRGSRDRLARESGEALYELSRTGLGAPFLGRPDGDRTLLRTEPGLWLVQVPDISLPGPNEPRAEWSVQQRLSVALVHSLLAYGISTASRRDLRALPKIIAVPEVHVLTATPEGAAFLGYVGRVGRSLGAGLALDTQDVTTLAALVGVVEQITAVFGFQLTTPAEQDALAQLLGLPVGPRTRQLLYAIGLDQAHGIRHGHCVYRDWRGRAATVQIDVPDAGLLRMLDTTPKSATVTAAAGVST